MAVHSLSANGGAAAAANGGLNDFKASAQVEPQKQSIDQVLSEELFEMSLKDRNKIDEEIHGVAILAPEESPELLEESLRELSRELDALPEEKSAAYRDSQQLAETYVNGSDFRLRFLRCELFDAPKAAIRLANFLDFTSELFGPDVLERPMRLSDFSKEEEKIIRNGNVQVFPYRDRSGRPIFCWCGDWGMDEASLATIFRRAFYLQYAMADDAESQRKGMTKLVWAANQNPLESMFPKREIFEWGKRFSAAIPLRTSAVHWCFPDRPYFHLLRSWYGMSLGSAKSRLKFHIGEEVELLYELKTYGIPVELIPVTGSGTVKTTALKQWMRARKQIDTARAKQKPKGGSKHDESSSSSSSPVIVCPNSTDVLFRAGTSLLCHPGNSMLQSLIESRIHEHASATQQEKIAITKTIIFIVKMRGGRFLLWEKKGWYTEMEDPVLIHAKVAASVKAFKFKPIANRQTNRSSTFVFQNQDHAKRRRLLNFRSDDASTSDSSFADSESGCCFSFMS